MFGKFFVDVFHEKTNKKITIGNICRPKVKQVKSHKRWYNPENKLSNYQRTINLSKENMHTKWDRDFNIIFQMLKFE